MDPSIPNHYKTDVIYSLLKQIIFFLLVITTMSGTALAQYSNAEIDSLIHISDQEFRKPGDFDGALVFYKKTLAASKNNGYEKGIAWSHLNIGNVYSLFGNFAESLRHLDSALIVSSQFDDPNFEVLAAIEVVKVYNSLGYYQNALSVCKVALEKAQAIHDVEQRNRRLQYLHSAIAVVYDRRREGRQFLENIKKSQYHYPTPFTASRIAKYFLDYEILPDSARKYLDEAQGLWKTGKFNIHQNSILLRNEGRYQFVLKNLSQAVDFYHKSIHISRQLHDLYEETTTLKLLYEAYKELNDAPGKDSTLARYATLVDSLNQNRVVAAEIPVSRWLEKKQDEHRMELVRLYILSSLIFLVLSWGLLTLWRRNRPKEKSEPVTMAVISQEDFLKKIKEEYQELFQLAKMNDPAFYFSLREAFPKFEQSLYSLDDGLRASEFTLLGYLFLGFNTKQIAEYTFKSVRTIENRKYQIRKKLNIPSEEDMGLWVRKRINEPN